MENEETAKENNQDEFDNVEVEAIEGEASRRKSRVPEHTSQLVQNREETSANSGP